MNKEEEIEKLKKRVDELERNRVIPVYYPVIMNPSHLTPQLPNCHYHNGFPCYNNPCYWAGL